MDEFLGGVACAVVCSLLAEVVLEHELVHGGVEGYCLAWLTSEVVLLTEDIDQLRGKFLVRVRVGFVGVLTDLHEELDVVEFLQLVAVFLDGAADESMLLEFL